MTYIDSKYAHLIIFLCVPLIFLPKINLINLSGENAGLRLDDFVLFISFCLILFANILNHVKLSKIELTLLALLGLSIGNHLYLSLLKESDYIYATGRILYSFRLLEYFIFFYVGHCFSRFYRFETLIMVFFLENLMVMILQYFSLIGGFTVTGYKASVANRVMGTTSGAWEISFILTLFICCFFLYENKSRIKLHTQNFKIPKFIKEFAIFTLLFFLIFITGSRISMLGLIIIYGLKLIRDAKNSFQLSKFFNLMSIGVIIITLFSANLYFKKSDLIARSQNLFKTDNISMFVKTFKSINVEDKNFYDTAYKIDLDESESSDQSWFMRIFKWGYAIKYFLYHPELMLFGVGAGFFGIALDGGLVRVITEYGIIGSFVFFYLFYLLWKSHPLIKWMIIALFINMLFIDIHMSYKGMSLFFFICGCLNEYRHDQIINNTPHIKQYHIHRGLK